MFARAWRITPSCRPSTPVLASRVGGVAEIVSKPTVGHAIAFDTPAALAEAMSAAIAQGALEVQYGDKKVTYRSLDDMIRILGIMGAALGVNISGSGRRVADFNNGLGGNCSNHHIDGCGCPW